MLHRYMYLGLYTHTKSYIAMVPLKWKNQKKNCPLFNWLNGEHSIVYGICPLVCQFSKLEKRDENRCISRERIQQAVNNSIRQWNNVVKNVVDDAFYEHLSNIQLECIQEMAIILLCYIFIFSLLEFFIFM